METRMLRIALIGCGDHSRRFHAPSLLKYHQDHPGEIALAAACDIELPKARAFCEQFTFAKPYADYKAMLADESIDGCICPVAGEKIVEISCHLLEAGIPSLIEKPLGTSLADARRLVEVAGKTGTAHLVSVNRRFNP
ncbi:MAG: Gfo/Idh/MocA family oxidoreductase, partial [Phycisphaerae bacterium]|nr:Gfo/Idh/MocA family oxidoreductase [Phycisphaerae bacterium]